MATLFRNTDLIGTTAGTPSITLASGNTLIIGQDAQIANTAIGVQATILFIGDNAISLDGDVYGNAGPALSGGSGTIDISETATVAAWSGTAIFSDSILWVHNAGQVSGMRGIVADRLRLVNEGSLTAEQQAAMSTDTIGGSEIVNSGTITTLQGTAVIQLASAGGNSIMNTGSILSTKASTVTSAILFLSSAVGTSSNPNIVENQGGTISGARAGFVPGAIYGAGGSERVTNTGVILGGVALNGGDDRYDGRGGTLQGTLSLWTGNDTAFGGAGDETIDAGSGNDLVEGGEGNDSILGGGDGDSILGGAGNDIITDLLGSQFIDGGDGRDLITTGSSDDTIDGGAGDDIVNAGDGRDILSGGDGANDLVSYAASGFGVTVNLGADDAAGGHAEGDDIAGFEGAIGSAAVDILTGSGGANLLRGLDGNDVIAGLGGNDRLLGDTGSDTLIGGQGADFLWGSLGADRYRYTQVTDSGVTGASRDRLMDFNHAHSDRIDLAAIDADSGTAGDQAFVLTGSGGTAAFTGVAGQLRFQHTIAVTLVQADTDGDAVADFAIQINDIVVLTAVDFVL